MLTLFLLFSPSDSFSLSVVMILHSAILKSCELKWKNSVLTKVETIFLSARPPLMTPLPLKGNKVVVKDFCQLSQPFVPPRKQERCREDPFQKWGIYPEICGKSSGKGVLPHWSQYVCLSFLVESGFVHSVEICPSQKLSMTVINLLTALKKENWKTLGVWHP